MKIIIKILLCLCISTSVYSSTEDVINNYVQHVDYAQRMKEIESESYKAVDEIFTRIRLAIINKDDTSNYQWFKYLKDNELQYLLTESRIHSFDTMTPNIMPEKINSYLQKKIRGDMQLVFAQGVDIKGVKQFLVTSTMMCELSDGVNCRELIGEIKNENRQIIDELKKQRDAQQKEACLARENMLSQEHK